MPKKLRYARIAITLPEDDLATADRLARQFDRPRSWVIAEAVRQYATTAPPTPGRGVSGGEQLRAGIGPSRHAQVIADLRLTPKARVQAAEEAARVSFVRRPPIGKRVLAFDRYEDYLEWKRREETGG